jgi:hypothetical protein
VHINLNIQRHYECIKRIVLDCREFNVTSIVVSKRGESAKLFEMKRHKFNPDELEVTNGFAFTISKIQGATLHDDVHLDLSKAPACGRLTSSFELAYVAISRTSDANKQFLFPDVAEKGYDHIRTLKPPAALVDWLAGMKAKARGERLARNKTAEAERIRTKKTQRNAPKPQAPTKAPLRAMPGMSRCAPKEALPGGGRTSLTTRGTGISNLGATCYANSAIQIFAQVLSPSLPAPVHSPLAAAVDVILSNTSNSEARAAAVTALRMDLAELDQEYANPNQHCDARLFLEHIFQRFFTSEVETPWNEILPADLYAELRPNHRGCQKPVRIVGQVDVIRRQCRNCRHTLTTVNETEIGIHSHSLGWNFPETDANSRTVHSFRCAVCCQCPRVDSQHHDTLAHDSLPLCEAIVLGRLFFADQHECGCPQIDRAPACTYAASAHQPVRDRAAALLCAGRLANNSDETITRISVGSTFVIRSFQRGIFVQGRDLKIRTPVTQLFAPLVVSGCEYHLVAALVHRGLRTLSGHYVCYCRSGDHVVEFNDATVTSIQSFESVQDFAEDVSLAVYKRELGAAIVNELPAVVVREDPAGGADVDIVVEDVPSAHPQRAVNKRPRNNDADEASAPHRSQVKPPVGGSMPAPQPAPKRPQKLPSATKKSSPKGPTAPKGKSILEWLCGNTGKELS